MTKGLANISLVFGLALIVAITPLALKLVQQNQNLENRAATETKYLPCAVINSTYLSYCQRYTIGTQPTANTATITSTSGIPCSRLQSALSQYCSGTAAY